MATKKEVAKKEPKKELNEFGFEVGAVLSLKDEQRLRQLRHKKLLKEQLKNAK